MREQLERISNALHLLIAIGCIALIASSPWIGMYHRLPEAPGVLDLGHVVVGLALLPLALVYVAACTVGGRWRLYFPWAAGQFSALGSDLAGIFRGERPGSEAGGLFATLEGLLLVALLAAALSGGAWWLAQGAEAAVAWRAAHIASARALMVLLLLHVIAVSLHLIDLVRD